jgi:CRP-like cAMP-binding protein
MAKQVMPQARLESRPTDVPFTDAILPKISLFAQLKRKPSLDKFPGTLAVRRYRKGEVICRQGEAGWTAFYCLSTEDVLALREAQLEAAPEGREKKALQAEVDLLKQRVAGLKSAGDNPEARRVATFYLTVGSSSPVSRQGLLQRLLRRWAGDGQEAEDQPATIRIDAPTDIDYETKQAGIQEGELFGEMSCKYGTPRSATAVADRDCYMLEMLRNILDQVQKDPAYAAHLDDIYRKRVIQLHLRKLSFFADLNDEQFARLRDQVALQTCDPGEVIYDEHEQSDDVYIIRTGLVRVVKKASALLSQENVRDWQRLGAWLQEGEAKPAGPVGKVWALLPKEARDAARGAVGSRFVPEAQRLTLLHGLNGIIANRQFPEGKEFVEVFASPTFQGKTPGLVVAERKKWSAQEARQFNRHVLDHVAGGILREYRRRVGPDCVLFYCTRGDFIGEAGLLGQRVRGETCLAHGHPKDVGTAKEAGPVELVRIPRAALEPLLGEAPALRRKVERKAAERKRQTQERVRVPVWDDSRQVLLSERFEDLGLIQGQRLMLIDLNRCTRCDECVRACVATHADGHSRLYLDGPRFGQYLVPTSCRSCLDPVCMIGCPVGSIHRGHNGQMVIEDWCIGCGLCAQQCPYGSIRMNDIGIISEAGGDWRYLPLSVVGQAAWTRPGYRDRRWLKGVGPFRNDRGFRERLAPYLKTAGATGEGPRSTSLAFSLAEFVMHNPSAASGRVGQPVCFRCAFTVRREALRGGSRFKLEIAAPDPGLHVWLNGQEIQPTEKPKGGKREYWFPLKAPAAPAGEAPAAPATKAELMPLRPGKNLLAVQVNPDTPGDGPFLKVRLDEVRKPTVAADVSDEVTQKLVPERAVVCDLCSGQLGAVPACVNACPHDAAMRVDARSDFPVG